MCKRQTECFLILQFYLLICSQLPVLSFLRVIPEFYAVIMQVTVNTCCDSEPDLWKGCTKPTRTVQNKWLAVNNAVTAFAQESVISSLCFPQICSCCQSHSESLSKIPVKNLYCLKENIPVLQVLHYSHYFLQQCNFTCIKEMDLCLFL